jgi:acetyltransferase-like isoleucine patch superfamily enzyme
MEDSNNHPVMIEHGVTNVTFGKNVRIISPSNIYGCEIGDDSFVGPFVEIQSNVRIGKKVKIQSHSFICELVDIGDNVFVGHGVMFINDLFQSGGPARGDRTKWKSTKIGNNVSIGSNATILPVSICDGVVIGAGAVVVKNITQKGIYVGNPAKILKAL